MNSDEFPPLEDQITLERDRMAPLEEMVIEGMIRHDMPLAQASMRLKQAKKISRFWNRKSQQQYVLAQLELVRVMLRIMIHFRHNNPVSHKNLLNLIFFSQFLTKGGQLKCVKIGSFNPAAISENSRYMKDYMENGTLDLMVPEVLTSISAKDEFEVFIKLVDGMPYTLDTNWFELYRRNIFRVQQYRQAQKKD